MRIISVNDFHPEIHSLLVSETIGLLLVAKAQVQCTRYKHKVQYSPRPQEVI
jgi:hypothetical protein